MENKERSLAMSPSVLRSVEDLLVKTFGSAVGSNFLYEIGRVSGEESMKRLARRRRRIANPRELSRLQSTLALIWGWETVKAIEVDLQKRIVRYRCMGSTFVRKMTKTPACHFGRGSAAGSLTLLLGRKCESIEVACEGRGDDYCELITGTPAEIIRLAENLSEPAPVSS